MGGGGGEDAEAGAGAGAPEAGSESGLAAPFWSQLSRNAIMYISITMTMAMIMMTMAMI